MKGTDIMNKVTLELTIDHLNIIIAGLAKLPLENAIETFTIVREQANAQLQQPAPATE